MPKILNWNAILAGYWGGEGNLNLKRKKQAEFLVSQDLPSKFIIGFICYNDLAKNKLANMGIDENKIRVHPADYY